MRVVRSINNNIAVCIDSVGNELIAMGKGIGYGELPREVSLEDVTQTFYNVSPEALSGIKDIPEDVMAFSADLAERARDELPYELSPNLAFTLADHIGFALRRGRENLYVSMPLVFDVKQSYPDEYRIARHAVRRLRRVFGVRADYPQVDACVEKICGHIRDEWGCVVTDEERLYIFIHANRLRAKEENN